jgi:NAD(P)-dependent dehydrogenase (short-subunit alcohol dehydrogenase family)
MKTILITGASRGIGAATAFLAAREGYAVIVNYRSNRTAAELVVAQIVSIGGNAKAIQADVSSEKEVERMFAEIDHSFGRLDSLINNAGILETQKRISDISLDRLRRMFETNFFSAFLCCQHAVRRMSTRNGGSGGTIVNVSSLASVTGAPFEYIDYATTKGALDTLTVGLSKELAQEGIRVNAVRPAFIHTEIHAAGGEPNRIERIKTEIPLQRGGTPEEVAEAILWLAGEKSSYTTGACINIAGGK